MISLKNFIELINAELLNKPVIDTLGSIVGIKKNIVRGSIYIYSKNDDIDELISLGVYAIIFTNIDIKYNHIKDSEIAFIYTNDLQISLTRYINYTKDVEIIYIDNYITFSFLKYFKNSSYNTIDSLLSGIDKILYSDGKLFTNNLEFKNLNGFKQYQKNDKKIFNYKINNIYEVELQYKNIVSNINIVTLLTKEFIEALTILDTYNLLYDLNQIKSNQEFNIIFVDKNLKPVKNGSSNQAIIYINEKYIDYYYNKLKELYSWLKITKKREEFYKNNYLIVSNCELNNKQDNIFIFEI